MINFTLPELDGKKHSLEEWRGKVIVLNFWATWCPPCREEIPLLIALQKERAAEGLQVVSVAIDNKTAVMLYRQSAGINYPVLMGGDEAPRPGRPLRQQHGGPALYRHHRSQWRHRRAQIGRLYPERA